jgi:flagellin-specific chaperone FliS
MIEQNNEDGMAHAAQHMVEVYDNEVAEQPVQTPRQLEVINCGTRDSFAEAANAYRREHLLNLTPVQVVKKLYDTAIFACKKKDYSLAHRAISQLILGLNFDYEELAGGLMSLYMYAKECIRKGDVAEAISTLEELRSAWMQAFNL